MTRNNRYTKQGQSEIFTEELLKLFDEMAENVELITEYTEPLDINMPNHWIDAIDYCSSELYILQISLNDLSKTLENMKSMLEAFHPDFYKSAPCKNSSTLYLYMAMIDIERSISKIIVELENILLEYMFLLSQADKFNWKTIRLFSTNTFDEEMFELIKSNSKLFYDESNKTSNHSSLDNNFCSVFDSIFNFYINQKNEDIEDWTLYPLLINKIICKVLKNDYNSYNDFIDKPKNNIIKLKPKF